MSLISTKNFVAPLTNKLHIISLILATTAFVVLRLSGAAIRLEPRAAGRNANTPAHQSEDKSTAKPAARQEAPLDSDIENDFGQSAKPDRSLSKFQDIVDSVKPPWEEKKNKPAKQPDAAGKKNSLDDIEKKLGLK